MSRSSSTIRTRSVIRCLRRQTHGEHTSLAGRGFDVNVDPGTHTVELFTIAGSYVGNERNGAAWTSWPRVSVTSAGFDIPTPAFRGLSLTIPLGTTLGVYITVNAGRSVNYTNGTAVGSVFATDGVIDILEGSGNGPNFGAAFTPRVWNGRVEYAVGSTPACGPTTYQVNQPEATLTIDGVQTAGVQPAVTVAGTSGTGARVALSSRLGGGTPWDFCFNAAPLIPAPGGLVLPSGMERVNLDLGAGPTFSINGPNCPTLGMWPGNFSFTVPCTTPFLASAQMLVVDATSPDGIRFSQGAELRCVTDPGLSSAAACPGIGTVPPLGDDAFVQQTLGFGFPFYGTTFSSVFVGSNGLVTFGRGEAYWPDGGNALNAGRPMIAVWAEDFDPSVAGAIRFQTDGLSMFSVAWEGVFIKGLPNANTFCVSCVAGTSIQMDYDASSSGGMVGTIGVSAGSSLNQTMPVNFSAASGMAIPTRRTAFEDFPVGGPAFDLAGLQILWALDATGTPLAVF